MLIIKNVTASCGCTIPEKPEEPIAPGNTGKIKATFDSRGRAGMNQKVITVVANTKETIESEVKRFIDEAYINAKKILTDKNAEWERLAQGLLEYETLTGEEIKRVMRGEPPQPGPDEKADDDASGQPSITAVPKTKAKPRRKGGMEPEPT